RTRSRRATARGEGNPALSAPASLPRRLRRPRHAPRLVHLAPPSLSAPDPRRSLGSAKLCPRERRHPEALAHLAQQLGVVGVPGHTGRYPATQRAAEEVEVAQDVEDLVAHEFVGEAERRVHPPLLADQDAIVEAAAAGEPHLLELLD